MTDQQGQERCPTCRKPYAERFGCPDPFHNPAPPPPSLPDVEERWTIWACKCGAWDRYVDGDVDNRSYNGRCRYCLSPDRWRRIEVVPASLLDQARVERDEARAQRDAAQRTHSSCGDDLAFAADEATDYREALENVCELAHSETGKPTDVIAWMDRTARGALARAQAAAEALECDPAFTRIGRANARAQSAEAQRDALRVALERVKANTLTRCQSVDEALARMERIHDDADAALDQLKEEHDG